MRTTTEAMHWLGLHHPKFKYLLSIGVIEMTPIKYGERHFWDDDFLIKQRERIASHAQELAKKQFASDMELAEKYARMPMQVIADELVVTRARIQQRLARVGISRKDGGASERSEANKKRLAVAMRQNQAERCQKLYGCGLEEFYAIAGVSFPSRRAWIIRRWYRHKVNATRNKIPWLLTLPQYVILLGDKQIALHATGMVISRKDKTEPFTVENTTFTTLAKNSAETRYQEARRRAADAVKLHDGGMPPSEIAVKFGVSVHSVKAWIYKAQNTLMAT